MGGLFSELLTNYTLRAVALGSVFLGFVTGLLGSFAVMRRQSLLGDAVSHAALPGIVLAFLLTASREPVVLLVGAAVAGGIGMLFLMQITRKTIIKQDAALGIVLSVFFGFGILLLTFVQRMPDAGKAGLDRYLFGQAATIITRDVVTIATLGGAVLLTTILFWKEFVVLTFDREYAHTLGLPIRSLDILLTILLVIATVVGLQMVGVVLMSAMLVAPVSAARQWTHRFSVMALLSGFLGAAVGLSGALLSSQIPRLPTGPTIVLILSGVVVFSLLFSPERGLIAQARIRHIRTWQYATETLAIHLLHHEGTHEENLEATAEHLKLHLGWEELYAKKVVRWAVIHGIITRTNAHLALTPFGRELARQVMAR
ncbi:MAG TPA: metal ABC transporter permease [Atribacteraceae bacterium]|nr:metal ABC transporter permease [Atribacteraceae bacterium]